jgi:hypothetical protein
VPALPSLIITLRGRQHGQERQRPHALGPRDRHQQHHIQPAQATGFDEMTVTRSHWTPIDPAGFDLRPPASLNRVIEAHNNRTTDGKGLDQQQQQNTTDFPTRPHGPIQHSMLRLKLRRVAQPHNPQHAKDLSRNNGYPYFTVETGYLTSASKLCTKVEISTP